MNDRLNDKSYIAIVDCLDCGCRQTRIRETGKIFQCVKCKYSGFSEVEVMKFDTQVRTIPNGKVGQ